MANRSGTGSWMITLIAWLFIYFRQRSAVPVPSWIPPPTPSACRAFVGEFSLTYAMTLPVLAYASASSAGLRFRQPLVGQRVGIQNLRGRVWTHFVLPVALRRFLICGSTCGHMTRYAVPSALAYGPLIALIANRLNRAMLKGTALLFFRRGDDGWPCGLRNASGLSRCGRHCQRVECRAAVNCALAKLSRIRCSGIRARRGSMRADRSTRMHRASSGWPIGAYATGGFGYVGGMTSTTTIVVPNSPDVPLFQRDRYWTASAAPGYRFTVPNGRYEVTLRFVETAFNSAGRRALFQRQDSRSCLPLQLRHLCRGWRQGQGHRQNVYRECIGGHSQYRLRQGDGQSQSECHFGHPKVTSLPTGAARAIRMPGCGSILSYLCSGSRGGETMISIRPSICPY